MPIPDLAKLIAAEIELAGVSGTELARRAGVAQRTLLDVTCGKSTNPGYRTILKILGALGHDFQWLHDKGFTPKSLGFKSKTTTTTQTVHTVESN